jgi:hypothetical protein
VVVLGSNSELWDPGPLDRDLWDPGRWGPMGTHVSQAPDRRVGEAAETKSRRCEVKTWRR